MLPKLCAINKIKETAEKEVWEATEVKECEDGHFGGYVRSINATLKYYFANVPAWSANITAAHDAHHAFWKQQIGLMIGQMAGMDFSCILPSRWKPVQPLTGEKSSGMGGQAFGTR